MPEESETAAFGVIKPAQEVRKAGTDAPLGGPDAESVWMRCLPHQCEHRTHLE
jgi:hypothetical protein